LVRRNSEGTSTLITLDSNEGFYRVPKCVVSKCCRLTVVVGETRLRRESQVRANNR